MFSVIRQMLYADADFDDWPSPDQEAADIGTGTPNIWPNYSGSFAVQVCHRHIRLNKCDVGHMQCSTHIILWRISLVFLLVAILERRRRKLPPRSHI